MRAATDEEDGEAAVPRKVVAATPVRQAAVSEKLQRAGALQTPRSNFWHTFQCHMRWEYTAVQLPVDEWYF